MNNLRHNNKGYTLIELLTVAVILVIISTVIAGIIASTLRGTAKSKVVNSVSQNGNYTLSVISGIIINSTKILDPDDPVDTTTGVDNILDCSTDPIEMQGIYLRRSDGGLTQLACTTYTDTVSGNEKVKITSESASFGTPQAVDLTDTNAVDVLVNSANKCSFVCSQKTIFDSPTIEVNFTLKPHTPDDSGDPQIPYTTQILMRNYRNQ